MKEFRSFPKSEKKPKLTKQQQWYAMQKRSLEKKKLAKKDVVEEDKKFFLDNYLKAAKDGTWVCSECNLKLPHFAVNDEELSFAVRPFQHHLLLKSKWSQFRHDTRNIIFLCWEHHQCAESAISYPKMKVYNYCESVKKELLGL